MPRCIRCKTLKSPRKYESSSGYEDEYERPSIPADVLEAYRESIG